MIGYREYQEKAMRTANKSLTDSERLAHGILGLAAEVQEYREAHGPDERLAEMGDVLWMVAEIEDAMGINMAKEPYERMRNGHPMEHYSAELCGMLQKTYQGHEFDDARAHMACADLLLEVAWELDDIGFSVETAMEYNVTKLMRRYPDGFSEERSVGRDV